MKKPNKQNICNAGEYYIASVLSAYGFTTNITLGRAEECDILTVTPKGKAVKLQVKTLWDKVTRWRSNTKFESISEDGFFYAFVRLNNFEEPPEYWIVPTTLVSKIVKHRHRRWLKNLNRHGRKHKENPMRDFTITDDKVNNPYYWNKEEAKKYYKAEGIKLLLHKK